MSAVTSSVVVRKLNTQIRSENTPRNRVDEISLVDDPEFRSAFVAYLEWGSRLAVINSQPGVPDPPRAPMPKWGWGIPGGPYRPNAE
jgi:hypothetical protein